MKKQLCVISHTHWDREWYYPFETFRLWLVDLIDRLVEIIGQNPSYIFHLDAQMIVLEDYLEIRPHMRARLTALIRAGNIRIGPWYLQNDFYLTSGESTIRNLLIGRKLCEAFGSKENVGYAPDQFGNISQLPQILNGFGIDSFIFGRGYNEFYLDEKGALHERLRPWEFIWEGYAGSRLYASFMGRWYNNAQRFSEDLTKSRKLIADNLDTFKKTGGISTILLMNGVDHLQAQDNLLPILDKLNQTEEYDIGQGTLTGYVSVLKHELDQKGSAAHRHNGALNQGNDYQLLRNCWSSRITVKQSNVAMQDRVELVLEPLFTMLELYGLRRIYPKDELDYFWKQLIKTHPHDNICGCSHDGVYRNMASTYERLEEFSDNLIARGMKAVFEHTKGRTEDISRYCITVANTTQLVRSEVVPVTLDTLCSDGFTGLSIVDSAGCPVEYIVRKHSRTDVRVTTPINLPGVVDVDRFEVDLYVADLPPYSVRSYYVMNGKRGVAQENIANKKQELRLVSDCVSLHIDNSGKISYRDLQNGFCSDNVFAIEDRADSGDSYVCHPTGKPRYYTCTAVTPLDSDTLKQSVRLDYACTLPRGLGKAKRGAVTNRVSVTFTLQKGVPFLTLSYSLENRAEDHRIRFIFDSGVYDRVSLSDSPFDIIENDNAEQYPLTDDQVYCARSFAALGRVDNCFAVLNAGQHEYENREDGRLAVTVLRSTGFITGRSPSDRQDGAVPDNQMKGTYHGRLAVATGRVEDVNRYALRFRVKPVAFAGACDLKKFSGGRPFVQDSELNEYFYMPDDYPGVSIPDNVPALTAPDGVCVSALKQAEDKNGFILRLYNPYKKTVPLFLPDSIACQPVNIDESPANGSFSEQLLPGQIQTFRLLPNE